MAPLDERDKYRPRPGTGSIAGDRETGYGSRQPDRVVGGAGGGYQVTELPTGQDTRPSDPYGNPSNMYEKPVKNDKCKFLEVAQQNQKKYSQFLSYTHSQFGNSPELISSHPFVFDHVIIHFGELFPSLAIFNSMSHGVIVSTADAGMMAQFH